MSCGALTNVNFKLTIVNVRKVWYDLSEKNLTEGLARVGTRTRRTVNRKIGEKTSVRARWFSSFLVAFFRRV